MRIRMIFLLASVMCAAFASPAFAWWEYARWGMTAEELLAAGQGQVRPCLPNLEACDIRLRGYHPTYYSDGLTIAGLSAAAGFVFDESGKLTRTVLRFGGDLRNVKWLRDAFSKTYGQSADVQTTWMPHIIWRDDPTATSINLIDLSPTYIVIDYQPITAGR